MGQPCQQGRARRGWLSIWAALVILLGGSVAGAQTRETAGATTTAPRRIITISPNAAEIICALGACEAIVAVSKFCVHPPELADRPRVGGLFDPNLEKIIALKPDLVVLRGRSESLAGLCSSRGIDLYQDPTERLSDVATCITELGGRLHKKKEATALVARFDKELEQIAKRVAGRPRPRVLLTVSRSPDRLANILTAGKGCFLSDMLEIAGGANVFGEVELAYPQVSPESIIAARPEVIVELMPETPMTDALREQVLKTWRSLGPIPAVTDGRVHLLSDDHCLVPSLRYVKIVGKVARLLHPEAYGE